MLLGEKSLAPTSKKPGKTRRFYFYLINKEFYIVDLPGYGYARTSKAERERWGRFIESYLEERHFLSGVCHLVDARHPPTDIDREVIRFMKSEPVPYIIVLTKADKLGSNERRKKVQEMEKFLAEEFAVEVPVVLTSATKRQGGGELWKWLERLSI
jgi:GTP-binding protein